MTEKTRQPTESPLSVPLPWNLVAPAYAAEVMPTFETFAREALRLAAPAPGARVVDVACGPGTLTGLASAQGWVVDAVDFAPRMIDLLNARGLPNVTARVGDGQALPFADGTFAAAFSIFGLIFFPDPQRGIAELRRLLAPSGRAAISSWPPMEEAPLLGPVMSAVRKAAGEVTGQPPDPSGPPPLSAPQDCMQEMSAAFTDVQVHEVTAYERAESAEQFWDKAVRTMAPLVLLRRTIGDDAWQHIAQAGISATRAECGSGPVTGVLRALITVGTAG